MKDPEMARRIMDFLKLAGAKAIPAGSEFPEGSVIVVTRVQDFDPASNDMWDLEANKSYPREGLVCHTCKEPVVMSDSLYEMYERKPMPEAVGCGKCVLENLKKE